MPTKKVIQKKEGNGRKIAVAGAAAAVLALGGVFAYLTATDQAVNEFTLAEALEIKVVEPNWDTTDGTPDLDPTDEGYVAPNGIPDAAEDLVPGQTVAKDPAIENETAIDSYAIMRVKVPVATVQTTADKTAIPEVAAHEQELFTYTKKAGWTEVAYENDTVPVEGGYAIHTYIYDTVLAGNATTTALFDEVTLIDLIDGQIAEGDLEKQIDIIGYAIQKEGFSTPAAAWTAYQNQNGIS